MVALRCERLLMRTFVEEICGLGDSECCELRVWDEREGRARVCYPPQ